MSEPVTELDLQAYADGKLPEERRAAVAAWLAAHPEDAERMESYRRIAEELRAPTKGCWTSRFPSGCAALRPARFAGSPWWPCGSDSAPRWAGSPAGSCTLRKRSVQRLAGVMARRAAVAHATYSPEVRHPVEVGADQEAHLVKWLSKRLGTQLRAPHLEAVATASSAAASRRNGPRPLHVPVQPRHAGHALRSDMGSNRSTAFRYAREGSVDVFYWVDSKIGYAVSSGDISKENLLTSRTPPTSSSIRRNS